jgi:glycoside/pentoside/hexuronide:cation symporter, GPH family
MTPPDQLRLREKFCYGFGDLASVLYWTTFMKYLTFFYTDVFCLAPAAVGTMLLVSRSMDALFDPVMGMVADRTETRWGKFRPYLFWLCVPFALAGVLTFTTPSLGNAGKLVWACITYNVLMLLYTGINIPYTAMLGVLSPNPNERTSLSSIKFVGAFSAGILISSLLLPMARILGGGNAARGWQLSFVIIGVAAVVFFLVTFFNTRERVRPPVAQKTSVRRDLRDLVTNGPWLVLLATTITFILFVAIQSSVTVHYFKYFVGSQLVPTTRFHLFSMDVPVPVFLSFLGQPETWKFESLVSWFNGTGQAASLLGVLLVPFFARRAGRKTAFITLLVVAIASTAAFYFLRPDQILLLFAANIIGSVTGGPLSALLWAMYADTADYAEWKHGRRATGLVFSASIFSQKEGWAIGAWVALSLLARAGFTANVDQVPATLLGLRMLMSLIPAAVGVVSILIVAFYPLNEARMNAIEIDLKARRAADGSAPAAA